MSGTFRTPLTMDGRVTQVEWSNPHVWISSRREGCRRKSRQLDGGRQPSERAIASWLHHENSARRLGDRRGRLSIQGWRLARQRARHCFRRRQEVVRRFLGPGSHRANRRGNNNRLFGVLFPPPVIRAILLVAGDTSVIE